jgi:hypothetical protein
VGVPQGWSRCFGYDNLLALPGIKYGSLVAQPVAYSTGLITLPQLFHAEIIVFSEMLI